MCSVYIYYVYINTLKAYFENIYMYTFIFIEYNIFFYIIFILYYIIYYNYYYISNLDINTFNILT